MARTRARRRVVVVDNRPLAQRIGSRVRAARERAGLSQQALAAGRYTGAYISALERGVAKPSMAALTFLSERLGVPVREFLVDDGVGWTRLEADVRLASGDLERAIEIYRHLLTSAADRGVRAELLRGLAEALCRADRGSEGIAPAREAVELFTAVGRPSDATVASFWVATAHYRLGQLADARAQITEVLSGIRSEPHTDPDFRLRALTLAANIELWEGDYERSLALLEEARSLTDALDDRGRAAFLFSLALSYQQTGHAEAALLAGNQALTLYQAARTDEEIAAMQSMAALNCLRLGDLDRGERMLAEARQLVERLDAPRLLAFVDDADAEIALARHEPDLALERAESALRTAEASNNHQVMVSSHLTRARAHLAKGEHQLADREYGIAAKVLRKNGPPARLADVLNEWADLLSRTERHEEANQLYREAATSKGRR